MSSLTKDKLTSSVLQHSSDARRALASACHIVSTVPPAADFDQDPVSSTCTDDGADCLITHTAWGFAVHIRTMFSKSLSYHEL